MFMDFDSEQDLTDWIKEHSLNMFGEVLEWATLPKLNCDLSGWDSEGKFVIVEVKNWTDNSANRNMQEYVSIGQIIHYANVFQKGHPTVDLRLFIISNYSSEKVETCCEFLRAYGFDIQHLSYLEKVPEIVERVLVLLGNKC